MSGHSKWSTIKRAKGIADAKRGNTFTKIANSITIATKLGSSGDPNSNPRLRLAIDQARSVNMPKENIQRAIDKGLGNLPGQSLEEVTCEGFGPFKIAYLLEGVTDNKMRTLSEIRNIFEKNGGVLGSQGSTLYLFDKVGEIKIKNKGGGTEDEVLKLIDLGAEDVEDLGPEGRGYLVYINSPELNTMSQKITQAGFEVESSEIIYKPNLTTEISNKEQAEKVISFIEKLESHDDIQKVYANFDIPDL